MNLVGQRIGSYVVQKELGAGGTGTVYLCQHTLIDRMVAVKVLHDEGAHDPDQVARFFQEAKAAAEIGHPNIVVIIDFGHLDHAAGRPPYLMMEALDGMSLDKRLRQGGLSLPDVSHIMRQVCSALVASHGKGIIHRDLKPPNVFLSDRSFDRLFVTVLDFGTAKLTVPALDGHKTMIGMVLGTPAYMSPEQCEGKGNIDHRSDIYSLGVMLYEMLTGTMPFDGEVGELLLHQIFHAPPPLRERNPQVPPAWEALCLRMMEKAREDRFQSVTDLALALEDLDGHAAAYAAFRTERATVGKSGHTGYMPGVGAPPGGAVDAAIVGNDSRNTMHGTLEEFAAKARAAAPASGMYAAASGSHLAAPPSGVYAAAPPSGAYAAYRALPPSGAYPAMPSGAYQALPDTYPVTPPPAPHVPYDHLDLAPTSGSSAEHRSTSGYDDNPPYQPAMKRPDPTAACAALATDPRYAAFSRTLMIRPGGRWYDVVEVCRTGNVAPPPTLALEAGLVVTWVEHPQPDPGQAAVVFLSLRTGWSAVLLVPRARW